VNEPEASKRSAQVAGVLPIDVLPTPLAVLDSHHAVVTANRAFRALVASGPAPEGRTFRDVLQDAGIASVDTPFGKVFHIRRDDVERAYRLNLEPYQGGSLAMFSDVTEASVAVERLKIAGDVRAQLLHDAEIGTWRYDPDADVYYFSSELSLGHGEVAAPVPRATLRLIQHRDDAPKDDAIRDRLIHEGGTAVSEMRYLKAEGGWNHLLVHYRSGERLPSGLYEMFGVSQSITTLAEARDEASTIAQRLNLALKASRAGVFEYDYKKHAYWLSSEFAALVGPEALSRTAEEPFAIFHPDDHPIATDLGLRAAVQSGADPVDVRLVRADGECWVRLYLEVELNAEGKPRRGVGLMIDIDETKRQEIAVAEAKRAAEAATEAKSDFLASVSHEIRTPMNGIVGVLNLLKREDLSVDGGQLLEEALGCTEMLSQLINDVLDFSKIEAGRLELSPAPTDPVQITESVIRLVQPQAQDKGLYLRARFEDGLGWMEIDPVRLRQCLFNVIGNAVKFTERGGVEVRLSMVGTKQSPKLRCEVEDTGIGVPESAREIMFDRFRQVEGGSARRFGGTGLGLAISQQLARMMGGDLDYTSQEGAGSTFWFELAAPPAQGAERETEAAIDGAPLSGLCVLVVDDNRVNRLVATRTLEALGADAEAVEGGPEAIEAMKTHGFDLVLMDINMPGMDGLEATRRIRALGPSAAATPIVALTADVMRHQHEAYLAAGMNGVVPKPFSPAQLLVEIARLATDDAPEAEAEKMAS
jgi:signal transduction histidine kinase/CheY-like chemotaxis protein